MKELETLVKDSSIFGTVGIGHTRWASVGLISESNAHPVESIDTDE